MFIKAMYFVLSCVGWPNRKTCIDLQNYLFKINQSSQVNASVCNLGQTKSQVNTTWKLNEHLYKTDTSIKWTPGVGPCAPFFSHFTVC